MKLSVKSEYACLALIDLSERLDEGYVKIISISERKAIPKKYLEQILLALKQAGFVKSRMGIDGGYKLAKSPGEITLASVIRLMDGALAPVLSVSEYYYEPTPVEKSPKLINVFGEIRNFISEKLEHTTFADLV